jgi:hypothetical protein
MVLEKLPIDEHTNLPGSGVLGIAAHRMISSVTIVGCRFSLSRNQNCHSSKKETKNSMTDISEVNVENVGNQIIEPVVIAELPGSSDNAKEAPSPGVAEPGDGFVGEPPIKPDVLPDQ